LSQIQDVRDISHRSVASHAVTHQWLRLGLIAGVTIIVCEGEGGINIQTYRWQRGVVPTVGYPARLELLKLWGWSAANRQCTRGRCSVQTYFRRGLLNVHMDSVHVETV